MKNTIIIILITFLLSGCSTTQLINPSLVKSEEAIMKDCREYIKPNIDNFSLEELMNVIIDNKKIYIDCSEQNTAKKNFIVRQQKT